jgi:hypothetical protein
MPIKSVVNVNIRRQDGWYVATSNDLKGFIVCHQSMAKLTQSMPECIEALFKANHGIDVQVEEVQLFDNPDIRQMAFETTRKAA